MTMKVMLVVMKVIIIIIKNHIRIYVQIVGTALLLICVLAIGTHGLNILKNVNDILIKPRVGTFVLQTAIPNKKQKIMTFQRSVTNQIDYVNS